MAATGPAITTRLLLIAALAACIVLFAAGCDEDDVEEVLGETSAASIESAYPTDHDPLINEWLTNAGQTLVAHSRRQTIPYEFRVIETDLVNAFAAPYGHIYVTRGFLDFAETEDEVWMVLAHEVGHVVHRDSIKSFKQSILMGILAEVISGESNTAGDIAGIGLGLLSLQYSRDDEYEADDAGTLLSYRAGYDPHEGLNFFHRLMTDIEKRRPSRWEVYFMTHPSTQDRINRQLARRELDPAQTEAVLQIARGYMLRGQPAVAASLLEKGLETAPDSPVVHSLLGDAYAARGQLDLARSHYQIAAQGEPDNRYLRTQLAALETMQPPSLPGMGGAERERAGELLARLDRVQGFAEETQERTSSYVAKTAARMEGLQASVRGVNNRLVDLADYQGDVQDATKDLVVRGNSAISKAIEPVYVLEAVSEDLDQTAAGVADLTAEIRRALEAARDGHGAPGDVAALETALLEVERATATMDSAMDEAPDTAREVRAASSSAEDLTGLVEMVVRRDEPDGLLADQLRNGATHTQRLGAEALAAVNRAKRQSIRACGHALLARLNVLGIGATEYQQRLFDRQIAHLFLVREDQVRELRQIGRGYGTTAMAIAAAKSARSQPRDFVPAIGSSVSPVSAAMEQGATMANVNVLLKFLVARLEAEREAAEAA